MENRITNLLKIKYPIIQGGMVWCCGWRLASAVSNSGGLGLLGAGSMTPDLLREHIRKCKAATGNPFGVNVPLIYQEIEGIVKVVLEEGVKIVFSSAGNPKTWTKKLKDQGITVIHVVSSSKFARKAEEAGVDAIVAEGFEAGGHNGKEETTTMTLIPQVRKATGLPVIAAGGIATGAGMLAAMSLGADGVQMGTRFALSEESSANPRFKEYCTKLEEGDTLLALKKLSPTRLVRNAFFTRVKEAEDRGASADELLQLLGRGRSKTGIFEGDLTDGELEIGQIASLIDKIEPVETIMKQIVEEYNHSLSIINLKGCLKSLNF
ncbi:MAG: nitronate monooxygenase [Dysgonamonadaceae bacterium]|jgi:enoyl-[acyl-carrier protein] reductase II|nr:nitronate monooxygenase [Dysgonamonadaceae bacterium]